MSAIQRSWQGWHPITLLLLPFTAIFCLAAFIRRLGFHLRLLKSHRLQAPVIVVGNITVGGTGKTPLIVWLAEHLKQLGYRPGVITRGYAGSSENWPCEVDETSQADEVGDEALLLHRRTGCPVFAGPDRYAAGKALLASHACDIILSDDGLQHYALERDLEIVVVDGERRFGNGLCLPAGPLRERPWRLNRADLVIVNGIAKEGEYAMQVGGEEALRLDGSEKRLLETFKHQTICAIAGIGYPQRFFDMLNRAGLAVKCYPFPDHHSFQEAELQALPCKTILMTEKDGVKCENFAQSDLWYIPASAKPDAGFQTAFEALINRLNDG